MDQHQTETVATADLRMAAAKASRQSFYYVHPLAAGRLRDWPALLDRVAGLGFSGVLLAPPFAAASVLLADRLEALHPALEWDDGAVSGLRSLDQMCRTHGLSWLLDVVLDRVAQGGAVARAAGQLYAAPGAAVVDPRRGEPAALLRPEAGEALADWWAERLIGWSGLGAAGFRLLGLGKVPPACLTALAVRAHQASPGCRMIGWTEDVADAALGALAGSGLDHTSFVLGGWDGTGDGPWDRLAALRRVAPPMVCVEAPFGPRLAAGVEDPALPPRAAARAVALAAALGGAWLMPMGVETGALAPLDPRHDAPDGASELPGIAAAARQANASPATGVAMRPVTAAGLACLAMAADVRAPERLVLVNRDLAREQPVRLDAVAAALGCAAGGSTAADGAGSGAIVLLPGEVREVALRPASPIRRGRQARPLSASAAGKSARVALERITPAVEAGRFAAKRVAGETVVVEADVLCDGHDKLAAVLQYRPADEVQWREARMVALGNDRWQAAFDVARPGRWLFRVEAWRDAFASFRDELAKKHAAGVDVQLGVAGGPRPGRPRPPTASRALGEVARAPCAQQDEASQVATLLAPDTRGDDGAGGHAAALRAPVAPDPLDAERVAAALRQLVRDLPALDERRRRRATARSATSSATCRASATWASTCCISRRSIRSAAPTARAATTRLTPAPTIPAAPTRSAAPRAATTRSIRELGTLDDFRRLIAAAARARAGDRARLRHPVLARPSVAARASGLVRLAARRLDHDTPRTRRRNTRTSSTSISTPPARCPACGWRCATWCCSGPTQGVRMFRVDNPHTKPFPFWEWLIAEVRARYPDAMFLAEAFTRPKVMYRLGQGRLLASPTPTSPGATRKRGAAGVPDRTDDHATSAISSGRTSSSTRRTSTRCSCRPPAAPAS